MTKKLIRYNIPGDPHGLAFSCYRNRRFLNNDRTREYFIEAVRHAKQNHNFDVWTYVIMPEHVHLVIFPKNDSYSISAILRSIKQSVSRRSITYLRKNNSGILTFMETGAQKPRWRFWQDGGGYDRNIRDSRELERLINYIHENPVRRGLVKNAAEWYWSSAHDWLNGTDRGPLQIDRESIPIF